MPEGDIFKKGVLARAIESAKWEIPLETALARERDIAAQSNIPVHLRIVVTDLFRGVYKLLWPDR